MANIDINRLDELKDELAFLNQDDVLFIEEDGQEKFAVVPIDLFNSVEDFLELLNEASSGPVVKVDSSNLDLSYDEYERIKNQIMEMVEKTLMPKPEKLN